LTILVADIDPLLAALGSAGAVAVKKFIGIGSPVMLHKAGWAVRVYCAGGRPTYQKTESGVTVVGGAEKVPVATNWICSPFTVCEMVMD